MTDFGEELGRLRARGLFLHELARRSHYDVGTLVEHRRVEDSVGARPLLPLIRSQLSTVAEFARSASGPLAGRLVGLASEYAQFLAWMSIDVQDHAGGLAASGCPEIMRGGQAGLAALPDGEVRRWNYVASC